MINHWSVGYELPALKIISLKKHEKAIRVRIVWGDSGNVVYEVGYCMRWHLNNVEQKDDGNLTWKVMMNNCGAPCATQTRDSSCSSHPHCHKHSQKVRGSSYWLMVTGTFGLFSHSVGNCHDPN